MMMVALTRYADDQTMWRKGVEIINTTEAYRVTIIAT